MTQPDTSYRAKLYLLTMPKRPQWITAAHFPTTIGDELIRAGLVEWLAGSNAEFVRTTEAGDEMIDRLMREGFGR